MKIAEAVGVNDEDRDAPLWIVQEAVWSLVAVAEVESVAVAR